MRERNQTTVVLTEFAQAIKDDLAPIFGLKNILSASLILFDKLSPNEQKETIAKANEISLKDDPKEALKNLERIIANSPPETIRNLVPDINKFTFNFRKLHKLSESQPKKNKVKRG